MSVSNNDHINRSAPISTGIPLPPTPGTVEGHNLTYSGITYDVKIIDPKTVNSFRPSNSSSLQEKSYEAKKDLSQETALTAKKTDEVRNFETERLEALGKFEQEALSENPQLARLAEFSKPLIEGIKSKAQKATDEIIEASKTQTPDRLAFLSGYAPRGEVSRPQMKEILHEIGSNEASMRQKLASSEKPYISQIIQLKNPDRSIQVEYHKDTTYLHLTDKFARGTFKECDALLDITNGRLQVKQNVIRQITINIEGESYSILDEKAKTPFQDYTKQNIDSFPTDKSFYEISPKVSGLPLPMLYVPIKNESGEITSGLMLVKVDNDTFVEIYNDQIFQSKEKLPGKEDKETEIILKENPKVVMDISRPRQFMSETSISKETGTSDELSGIDNVLYFNKHFDNDIHNEKTVIKQTSMYLDFYSLGDSAEMFMSEKIPAPSFDSRVNILTDMAKGVGGIHKLDLVQHDIKPDNFLVNLGPDGIYQAAIADNAMVSSKDARKSYSNGTGAYFSPEKFLAMTGDKSVILDQRADIFALGCTFFHQWNSNQYAELHVPWAAPVHRIWNELRSGNLTLEEMKEKAAEAGEHIQSAENFLLNYKAMLEDASFKENATAKFIEAQERYNSMLPSGTDPRPIQNELPEEIFEVQNRMNALIKRMLGPIEGRPSIAKVTMELESIGSLFSQSPLISMGLDAVNEAYWLQNS